MMSIALALAGHIIILNLIPVHWKARWIVAALSANTLAFMVTASYLVTRN